jgi:hypothetical protein
MKADDVIQAFVAALGADALLLTALGGSARIYRKGATRAPQIPSVEWFRVTDGLAESTEPMLFQFDVWAKDGGGALAYANAMAIEARIRAVLNRDGGLLTLGSLTLFAGLDDSRDHEDPEPGVVHTSLDFRFEPAKE